MSAPARKRNQRLVLPAFVKETHTSAPARIAQITMIARPRAVLAPVTTVAVSVRTRIVQVHRGRWDGWGSLTSEV